MKNKTDIKNNKQTDLKKEANKPFQNKKSIAKSRDFFEILDSFLFNKRTIFFIVSLILMLFVSVAIFDVKVSEGGDDSAYIVRAFNFIENFDFPGGFQGPMYPIILSLFVKILGINLPLLKALSAVFMLIFLVVFYRSSISKIPASLLFPVMILISVNIHLLYFSSQTYSEAFFMMIQAIVFAIMYKNFINEEPEKEGLKNCYKKFLILGFVIFITGITKNIGTLILIPILLFFALDKRWKAVGFTFVATAAFNIFYEIIKRILWSHKSSALQSQGSGLFYKDYYNPSKGYEDFWGFIERFIDNSNLYFSKHLFVFLGFKSMNVITPVLTIITYIVLIAAFIYIFRKNKFIRFIGIYTGLMFAFTFISIQKQWDQARLVIVYYPYVLLLVFSSIYYFLKKEKLRKFQPLLLLFMIIILVTTLATTIPFSKAKKDILRKNLSGNILFGLTPDWVNFIKMSQWAAVNIDQKYLIASRKPDISFVYTGRKFYPVFKVPSISADQLVSDLSKDSLPHSIAVKLEDVFPNPQFSVFFNNYRRNISAFLTGSKDNDKNPLKKETFTYVVFSLKEKNNADALKSLEAGKLTYFTDISSVVEQKKKEKFTLVVYDPDLILNQLKKEYVKYFIMPKIRRTGVKGQGIIDTMDRLLYYIELKYPIFKEIKKIGADEDSRLLEIQYEKMSDYYSTNTLQQRNPDSPDIKNYIDIFKWASQKFPKNTLIGGIDIGNLLPQTGCKLYPVMNVPVISQEDLIKKLKEDTMPISVAILLNDLINNKKIGQLFNQLRANIKAFIAGPRYVNGAMTNVTYIIYAFPKNTSQGMFNIFAENKINYIQDATKLLDDLKKENSRAFVYDPDMMLRKIKKDNVRYFVLANIRLDPSKHGKIIDTVNYFLYFTELKYPIMKVIHQTGKEENARLLEVQYENINKKIIQL